MWRHNEAAGEERGVRECVVRMWRQDASVEMECGVRECVVRMRRQVGMGMWRQGMQRQNAASGGNVASGENVASGNVSSECGTRGECSVKECVVGMWRQGMRRQGERQAPKCYTMRGHPDFYYFYYIILFVMTSLLWRSCDYYPCRLSLFQVDCDLFGRSFPNFIKIHQNSTLSLRLTASTILISKAELVGPLQKL